MKPSALRIERLLAKVEAALVPPPRKCLRVIIHEGDDEAAAKEKALAEHIAAHPEDAGRTVKDFNWVVHEIVHWASQLWSKHTERLPSGGQLCRPHSQRHEGCRLAGYAAGQVRTDPLKYDFN
jgi:hypothetical protein